MVKQNFVLSRLFAHYLIRRTITLVLKSLRCTVQPVKEFDPSGRMKFDSESGCSTAGEEELMELEEESEDVSEDDFFRAMSDELVLEVLSHLSLADVATRVSPVSRRFRRLCLDASLWTTLSLPPMDILDTSRALDLLPRCRRLNRLCLSRRPDGPRLALRALTACPGLRALSVAADAATNPDMLCILVREITAHGGALRELSMEGVPLDGLEMHAHHLSKLTHLDLGRCDGLGGRGLMALADHCLGLQYLRMGELYEEDLSCDDAMNYFLQRARTSLRHLLILGGRGLSDASFANLWWCTFLETLEVACASNLRRAGLQSILRLPRLRSLTIASARKLRGEHFASGGRRLPRLMALSLLACRRFDDAGLREVGNLFPNLASLTLTSCRQVTGHGFRCLLLRCGRLRTLTLRYVSSLTDVALTDITEMLPGLERLQLEACSLIGEDCLREIMVMKPELVLVSA